MRTVVTINKKTAKATFDVQDGQGTECREKNAKYYTRLRREFGLPDTAVQETEKPEMSTQQESQQQHERL